MLAGRSVRKLVIKPLIPSFIVFVLVDVVLVVEVVVVVVVVVELVVVVMIFVVFSFVHKETEGFMMVVFVFNIEIFCVRRRADDKKRMVRLEGVFVVEEWILSKAVLRAGSIVNDFWHVFHAFGVFDDSFAVCRMVEFRVKSIFRVMPLVGRVEEGFVFLRVNH